jgi:hypothetical protein
MRYLLLASFLGILTVNKNVAELFHRKNAKTCTLCKEVKIDINEGMFVKMNGREIDVSRADRRSDLLTLLSSRLVPK